MVKDYQDWEYCSVHISVQGEEHDALEKLANDALKNSLIEQQDSYTNNLHDNQTENEDLNQSISFAKDTLQDRLKDAVEVTSFDGNFDFDEALEDLQNDDVSSSSNFTQHSYEQKDDDESSVDIDVFFPSLLLSFESLLSRIFEDLLNGLKNHNLYSMGLAQHLKLEEEQIDGKVVKLRFRLPIDNVKFVFESMMT